MATKSAIRKWVKRHTGKHVCACGCGQIIEIKPHHHRTGIPKFIRGHNFASEYNPKSGTLDSKKIKTKSPRWMALSDEAKRKRIANLNQFGSMENHPQWKGGKHTDDYGYIHVRRPDHPFAVGGYVLEHRLVMEEYLREKHPNSSFLVKVGDELYLHPDIVVHHIDEVKDNNDLNNLFPMTTAEHVFWHKSTLPIHEKIDAIVSGKFKDTEEEQ